MIYVGIDPGKRGGIAVLGDKVTAIYRLDRVNETELREAFEDFKVMARSVDVLLVYERPITKAHIVYKPCPKCKRTIPMAVPQQGVITSLVSYGELLGLAKAHGLNVIEIPSAKWKKALNLSKDKSLSFDLVKKLYPDVEIKYKAQEGIAEAILIAHYAKTHNLKGEQDGTT